LEQRLQLALELLEHLVDLKVIDLSLAHLLSHALKHSMDDLLYALLRHSFMLLVSQGAPYLDQEEADLHPQLPENHLAQLIDQP
jgi:hypothetical protein